MRNRFAFILSAIFLLIASNTVWSEQKAFLWASNPVTKILRHHRPGDLNYRNSNVGDESILKMEGARNEIVSGQAVFAPVKDIEAVTVSISDLHHDSSNYKISSSKVRLQWVRYIDAYNNTGGIPYDVMVSKAPTSFPDPFWEDTTIPVHYGTKWILGMACYVTDYSYPIWVEVMVPKNAKPGDFSGTLRVTGGESPVEMPVKLHIWDFEMPDKRHQSVVNFWSLPGRYPFGITDVEKFSDEYWKVLGHMADFVVEHRQTDAIGLNIHEIIEKGDSTQGYTYDTKNFERYAEIVFEHGIRQIHTGHLSQGRDIGHLDGDNKVVPNESAFRKLAVLDKLVVRRGWENKFAVAIFDEPWIHHEESFTILTNRARKIALHCRLIEPVEAIYFGPLDIYVPKLTHLNMWWPKFEQKQKEGTEIWYYLARNPLGRYLNRFLDQPLIMPRLLFWMNYVKNIDGYLYWSLNAYGYDPYTELGAGDGAVMGNKGIAYPGEKRMIGSIRFSAQRDGLEDYEYLWLLEDKLSKLKDKVGEDAFWLDPRQRPIELCRRVIRDILDYTLDPQMLLDTRRAIAEEIEALKTEPLLYVQTTPPENTDFPLGPRLLNVRGIVNPGAKVFMNNKPVFNVRPSGYFMIYLTMLDEDPVVTFRVEYKGKTRTVTRKFNLIELQSEVTN